MKMAPLAAALARDGTFQLRLIHTGQHYHDKLSDVFFDELGIPAPTHNLNVGSSPQGEQTARILTAYEAVLLNGEAPAGVIVVGDVTSTMACALAAAKLNIPVAHVEAGLRSFDRTMPEEVNRVVTDALSDLLFVSDPDGLLNLAREGAAREKVHFVGNIMADTLYRELPRAEKSPILEDLGLWAGAYAYLTLHRPSNVDDINVLTALLICIGEIALNVPVIFAVHPRTRGRLQEASAHFTLPEGIRFVEPLGYRENLRLIQCAKAVLTDSGGIQEESALLNVPCLTLRSNTERPVTVKLGTSELVGNDPGRIRSAWQRVVAGQWKKAAPIPLWDGHTAERIVAQLRLVWT